MKGKLAAAIVIAMVAALLGSIPAIAEDVTVSATAPTPTVDLLTFTVTAGTAPVGGSVTNSGIDFGTLAHNTPKTGSHILDAATNMSTGYTVTAIENHDPENGIWHIHGVFGDDSDITHQVAGAWALDTTCGFGYTLTDNTGSAAAFTAGFKQFADASAAEAAQTVMSNVDPTLSDNVSVGYKVNIPPIAVEGTYTNTITYTCTTNP